VFRGPIRPDPRVCASADAACGEKFLFNWQNQAIFGSSDRPLGNVDLRLADGGLDVNELQKSIYLDMQKIGSKTSNEVSIFFASCFCKIITSDLPPDRKSSAEFLLYSNAIHHSVNQATIEHSSVAVYLAGALRNSQHDIYQFIPLLLICARAFHRDEMPSLTEYFRLTESLIDDLDVKEMPEEIFLMMREMKNLMTV
jgi:hypothetical protein